MSINFEDLDNIDKLRVKISRYIYWDEKEECNYFVDNEVNSKYRIYSESEDSAYYINKNKEKVYLP